VAGHTIFDQLEARFAANKSTRTPPPRWHEDAALAGCSPAVLVARAHTRSGAEPALAALVRRSSDDELAALTAALILLPAAKALLVRVPGLPGDAQERAMTVVEALWEVIRTYPCHRPGTVAGNVSAEVLKRLVAERDGLIRTNPRHQRRPVSVTATVDIDTLDDDLHAAAATSNAGAELLALLGQAVAAGQLDPKAATLIGRCRISDASADRLAAELGVQAQSVRRSRQRAERQLAAAAA
jgi:hypothetical protein